MARSSIYVGEIAHQSPIPNASRIGNIIVSGLIRGADPATARLAATLEQQCAFMFLHMRQAAEAGGATVEDIRREFHSKKACAPYCTIGCVHRASSIDSYRLNREGLFRSLSTQGQVRG